MTEQLRAWIGSAALALSLGLLSFGGEAQPGLGMAPVVDGTIRTEEWRGARRESFADGSELLLLRRGDELYIGIRANTPGMIAGNIFINRGDLIAIHHASGALGTAVYRKDGGEWRLVRDFSWRCRRFDDGDEARAEREAFFREENWIASNSRMGAPHELEYRIRIPGGPLRLAADFLCASDPTIKVSWPADLDDDTIRPTPGGLPQTSRFAPEKWAPIDPFPTGFPVLGGPYLGQQRPGPTAEIFAPGIVSLGFHEHNSVHASGSGYSEYLKFLLGTPLPGKRTLYWVASTVFDRTPATEIRIP